MPEDLELVEFSESLRSEVRDRATVDMGEFSFNAFVTIVSEHLAEMGILEDPITCHFEKKVGAGIVRLSGYSISDDGDRIDLLVAIVKGSGSPSSYSSSDVVRVARQAARALQASKRKIHEELETASDQYEMMERIHDALEAGIPQARVIVITDGLSAARTIDPETVAGIEVTFDVYDLQRLMRTMRSGQTREVIDIDFQRLGMPPIPCVEMPSGSEPYETYLAVVPGNTLFELYEKYGPAILEYNVRAFLQAAGKVNRGIRDTIRDRPGHFMAYNNGISVTADEVRTDVMQGITMVVGIKGLQIVNGGQTTASIHRARKRDKLDLSRVHVSAKITRLPPDSVEEMVPEISRFANTQNVIQEADFSSNEPFHITLERLSKGIWAPGEKTRWFYERSRGQYQTALNIEGTTEARIKAFRERTPPANRLSKTDLARNLNSFSRLPHIVSGGVQKNFIAYMKRLRESRGARWEPDENFYREAIAQTILFLGVQRIVRQEGFPAYRINIATYLVSYLSHRTGGRLSLSIIWQRQALSEELELLLRAWSHRIDRQIQSSADGRNITEWAKKEACWTGVKNLELPLEGSTPPEWGNGPAGQLPRQAEPAGDTQLAASICMRLAAEEWFAIHLWGTRTGNLATWQCGIAHTLSSYAGGNWQKVPTTKQAQQGLKILELAASKGFEGNVGQANAG
ncbi:hypothetical protein EHI46_24185 [Rhizobium leguminosarum]|uniref:AIPR family protein n=1 Tax=Rhizobium leguminosarum TaxID=384 RepID=UPI000FF620CF|nr:AIPR family protein [Rhizobium leguminosarum]RWY68524.1 hypothetical protein EHI46_24185 [Rhizobium leguminosarum]